MATATIQIAPECIADGKRLYELTLTPVADIAATMGISRRTLERRIHEWGWTPRSAPRLAADRTLTGLEPPPATANIESKPAAAALLSPAARIELAARIQSSVERGLDAVDRVLDRVGPADEGGAERSARTLAAIARTLQGMAALTTPEAEVTPPDETDDDPVPSDIDEFRRELTRRIRGFIEARRNGGGRLPDERESEMD